MGVADRFVAEIIMVPFNFTPTGGYLPCDGRLLSIAQYTPLFSLLGTTYGGDGKSTFALPDLSGRTPIGEGQGQGLTPRMLGEQGGASFVTLLESEIPFHTHVIKEKTLSLPVGTANNTHNPVGNYPGVAASQPLYAATAGTGTMPLRASLQTGVAGGSLPVNNMQPSLTIRFLIATTGTFPQRP
ncbi:MAG TPA: tail fiber protein [Chitinophaga sp.]